ncbi:MAG: CAP domain-containing protein [Candidatus Sulfotelmatobacter sp.]
MRIMLRLAAVLILGLAALLMAQAQTGGNTAEQELLSAVNRARRAQGLPALKWNEALAVAAHRHAALMAQHGAAEHGFPGEPGLASRATQAGAHFVWLSENVIQGSSVETIQAEFLRSPNHRANMLDSDMDSIGVGVVERGGQLFAVEDFSKAK